MQTSNLTNLMYGRSFTVRIHALEQVTDWTKSSDYIASCIKDKFDSLSNKLSQFSKANVIENGFWISQTMYHSENPERYTLHKYWSDPNESACLSNDYLKVTVYVADSLSGLPYGSIPDMKMVEPLIINPFVSRGVYVSNPKGYSNFGFYVQPPLLPKIDLNSVSSLLKLNDSFKDYKQAQPYPIHSIQRENETGPLFVTLFNRTFKDRNYSNAQDHVKWFNKTINRCMVEADEAVFKGAVLEQLATINQSLLGLAEANVQSKAQTLAHEIVTQALKMQKDKKEETK